jgi:hypothetical protein
MMAVAEIELHDEVVTWMVGLADAEWESGRGDRQARDAGPSGADAVVPQPRGWSVRAPLHAGSTARRITYRFTKDGKVILLTTFRKQRQNEQTEIVRARKVAETCARRFP